MSGMRTMKTEDLCVILKSCKEAGVTEIKYGGLIARFSTQTEALYNIHMPAEKVHSAEEDKKIEREHLEEQEILAKEERLALMAIEDPKQYEELIASGELEDIRDVTDAETQY